MIAMNDDRHRDMLDFPLLLLLLPLLLTFILGIQSPVEGNRKHYSIFIESLDKLATADFKIVRLLLEKQKGLAGNSKLHKTINK